MMTDTSPAGMRRAIEQSFWESWLALCTSPRVEVMESEEMIRFATGLPLPPFNEVMRARLEEQNVDRAIEQAIEYFAEKKLPWCWTFEESTTPTDLPARLVARGFVEDAPEPGMAMDLRGLPKTAGGPKGLAIEKVAGKELGGEYAEVLAAGFGMPEAIARGLGEIISGVPPSAEVRVCGYLGRLEGLPVATSLLVAAGGVAGIYNVTTLAACRGRGIGAAVTLAPLLEARSWGYRIGSLQASQMGYGVYERLGFREYYRIRQFVWMAGG